MIMMIFKVFAEIGNYKKQQSCSQSSSSINYVCDHSGHDDHLISGDQDDLRWSEMVTLSVGCILKSLGGLVITYRAIVASTSSERSRYLRDLMNKKYSLYSDLQSPIESMPWFLSAVTKRSSQVASPSFSRGEPAFDCDGLCVSDDGDKNVLKVKVKLMMVIKMLSK